MASEAVGVPEAAPGGSAEAPPAESAAAGRVPAADASPKAGRDAEDAASSDASSSSEASTSRSDSDGEKSRGRPRHSPSSVTSGSASGGSSGEGSGEDELDGGAPRFEGSPGLLKPEVGFLLKRKSGRRRLLARSRLGSWLQRLLWQRRHFLLGKEELVYQLKVGLAERRAFALVDIVKVAVEGREITITFSKPQKRTGHRDRSSLVLGAESSEEAEHWGDMIRVAVAGLRTGLPTGWDVQAMLRDGSGDASRLVAKKPLPEGAVTAMQQLMDHSFVCKGTKDRKGQEVPFRLEVAKVYGIQNISAWTEYIKARSSIGERLAGAGDRSQDRPLVPEVRTATVHSPKVQELLGEVDSLANEHWLFHGSTAAGVQNISSSEFQINLAGSHRGTMYGKGVYLAECCSKADEYAESGGDGLYGMLLCRVLLGRLLVDPSKRPNVEENVAKCTSGEYDALCGDRWTAVGTFREFIFYDSNRVYPAYIIYYRRTAFDSLVSSVRRADAWTDPDEALRLAVFVSRLADTHSHPSVRRGLELALRTHLRTVALPLLAHLSSEYPETRRLAVVTLGMLISDADEVMPKLRHACQDGDLKVRASACTALGRFGESAVSAVPDLKDRLGDSGLDVRKAAVKALAEMANFTQAALHILIATFDDDELRLTTVCALSGLGSTADPALPQLTAALKDSSPDIRCEAAKTIRHNVSDSAVKAVPELVRCLADPEERVRLAAIEALGALGASAKAAVSELAGCTEDSSELVVKAVLGALGNFGPAAADAVPAMVGCLHHSAGQIRIQAVTSLAKLGPTAVPVIASMQSLLMDPRTDVVCAAQTAIQKLHGCKMPRTSSSSKKRSSSRRSSSGSSSGAGSDERSEKKEKKGKKESKEKDKKGKKLSQEELDILERRKLREEVQLVQPPPSSCVGSLLRRTSL